MFAQLDFIVDDSVDNQKSEAVEVPQWAKRALLFVATTPTAVIGLEMIEEKNITAALLLPSNDTSWDTVRSQDESSTVLASGTANVWVDITEFIRSLPQGCHIRLSSNADLQADIACVIVFRG